mmetsp:Transcript_1175/g.4330  ORF Transcript_1175/g.4330 Transcript_1175/m.4330 type:complete len:299 (-) Transcript_1175:1113-2009(-)
MHCSIDVNGRSGAVGPHAAARTATHGIASPSFKFDASWRICARMPAGALRNVAAVNFKDSTRVVFGQVDKAVTVSPGTWFLRNKCAQITGLISASSIRTHSSRMAADENALIYIATDSSICAAFESINFGKPAVRARMARDELSPSATVTIPFQSDNMHPSAASLRDAILIKFSIVQDPLSDCMENASGALYMSNSCVSGASARNSPSENEAIDSKTLRPILGPGCARDTRKHARCSACFASVASVAPVAMEICHQRRNALDQLAFGNRVRWLNTSNARVAFSMSVLDGEASTVPTIA